MSDDVPGWLRDMEDPTVLQRMLEETAEVKAPEGAAPAPVSPAAPTVYQHRAMVNPSPAAPPALPSRQELSSRLPPVPSQTTTDEADGRA